METINIQPDWKQPIPTNLLDICNGNKFATTVFMILLCRASNKDRTIYHKGKPVYLKKGQCLCGREELAEWFGLKRKEAGRIQRILTYLEKTVTLINRRQTRHGSIISIVYFNEYVSDEEN